MKQKTILLVGGCGFIGHNLALKLNELGHKVFVVDSLSVNNLRSIEEENVQNKKLYKSILDNRVELLNKNNIELIIQDAREYREISRLYSKINPDVLVHLAAVSHANKSNKDPHSTFDHSFRTLENSLDFAKNDKTHLIYMSSSMVYGNFNSKDVDESTACNPIGIYGTLKFSGELLVKSYNQVFGLPYTIIRPSALYGERCVSRRVGQIFIENAIQGEKITVNGDGESKLDFTYIEDLVSGIASCCENSNAINQTFNLTYGNSRKINDLLLIIKSEFPNVKISYTEKEAFMPERGTLKTDNAKKLIQYKPKYAIDEGYIKYIKWYKDFWNKFKSE